MSTINGHTLQEIGVLMKKPFDENLFAKSEKDQSMYLPTEHFKNRLDEVIGVMNYDYELKSVRRYESVLAQGPKPLIEVQITITIKDDDGVPVKKCDGIGVTPAIVISDTGKEKNPNSDVSIAEKNAFKHLCQNVFGMADEQLSQLNSKSAKNKNSDSQQASADLPKGNMKEKIYLTKGFSRGGNNLYAKGKTETYQDIDIVIFGRELPGITKYMSESDFISKYTTGSEITLNGNYGMFNGRIQFKFHAEDTNK